MEQLSDRVQLWGAAGLLQELEESASADQVEYLRQVYEGKVERLVLSRHFSWSCLTEKIMSVVDLPALNPHWDSG